MRLAILRIAGPVVAAALLVGHAAASPTSTAPRREAGAQASPAAGPTIEPANFVRTIDNPYLPLKPGTTFVYEGTKEGQPQGDEVQVTHETKTILGVDCVVVRDRVTAEGKLLEDTRDWYAQDKDGNVWYFGEDSKSYENGKISTEGSWEAGVDGAQPGIIMPAQPKVGDSYRQEYYAGVAEDMAEVLSLSESVSVRYGSFHDVLLTREWTPLEPDTEENKSYAPGVGMILEVTTKGEKERFELVDVKTAGGEAPAGTPSAGSTSASILVAVSPADDGVAPARTNFPPGNLRLPS
jgi:hypothetical protein